MDEMTCFSDIKPMYLEAANYEKFAKDGGKKINVVERWSAKILLRVQTDGNWCKIINREVSILKVKLPFLPEKQIRGKAYKKFGIPATMGQITRPNSSKLPSSFAKELFKRRKHKPKLHRTQGTYCRKPKDEKPEICSHFTSSFRFQIDKNLQLTPETSDESTARVKKRRFMRELENDVPNGLKLSSSSTSVAEICQSHNCDASSMQSSAGFNGSNSCSDEPMVTQVQKMFEQDGDTSPELSYSENSYCVSPYSIPIMSGRNDMAKTLDGNTCVHKSRKNKSLNVNDNLVNNHAKFQNHRSDDSKPLNSLGEKPHTDNEISISPLDIPKSLKKPISIHFEKNHCVRELLNEIDTEKDRFPELDEIKRMTGSGSSINYRENYRVKEYSNNVQEKDYYHWSDSQISLMTHMSSISEFSSDDKNDNDATERQNERPLKFVICSQAVIDGNIRNNGSFLQSMNNNCTGVSKNSTNQENLRPSRRTTRMNSETRSADQESKIIVTNGVESSRLCNSNDRLRKILNCQNNADSKEDHGLYGNLSTVISLSGDTWKQNGYKIDSEDLTPISLSASYREVIRSLKCEPLSVFDTSLFTNVSFKNLATSETMDIDSSDEDFRGFTNSKFSSSLSSTLGRKSYSKRIERNFKHSSDGKKFLTQSPKRCQKSIESTINISTTNSALTDLNSRSLLSSQCCEYDVAYGNGTLKPLSYKRSEDPNITRKPTKPKIDQTKMKENSRDFNNNSSRNDSIENHQFHLRELINSKTMYIDDRTV